MTLQLHKDSDTWRLLDCMATSQNPLSITQLTERWTKKSFGFEIQDSTTKKHAMDNVLARLETLRELGAVKLANDDSRGQKSITLSEVGLTEYQSAV